MGNKSFFSLFAFFTFVACPSFAQTKTWFDFGSGHVPKNHSRVTAADVFSKQSGYGFEPSASVTCPAIGGKTSSGYCASEKPFYFSTVVPEGNYRVTITFGSRNDASSSTVKAELRRLMVENVTTQKGQFATRSFIVNVRTPQIATGGEVKLKDREKASEKWAWDEKLTIEFNGSRPTVNAIDVESVNVPTVFLLGDSTVCDQPTEPYARWGQMITRFFGPNVAVANHAESGESLKSSFGENALTRC